MASKSHHLEILVDWTPCKNPISCAQLCLLIYDVKTKLVIGDEKKHMVVIDI